MYSQSAFTSLPIVGTIGTNSSTCDRDHFHVNADATFALELPALPIVSPFLQFLYYGFYYRKYSIFSTAFYCSVKGQSSLFRVL